MVYSRLNIIRVTTRSITSSKGRKSLLFLSKQSGERGFRCVTLDELAQDRSGSGSWPDILWPDMDERLIRIEQESSGLRATPKSAALGNSLLIGNLGGHSPSGAQGSGC
jgi:hypothetical protein